MSLLWWLISLGIAAAIIYYLFSARGDIHEAAESGKPIRTGIDEEYAEDMEVETSLGEVDEGLAARAVPTLDDEDTTTLTNLDEAASLARGKRGVGGHDEEYGEDLPVELRGVPEDEDDLEEYDDNEQYDGYDYQNGKIENQTDIDAQVKKEPQNDKNDKKRRKRQKKH